MLKVVSLLKRAEGMSHDEFSAWVLTDHKPFAEKLPGLRRYVVNVGTDPDGEFDSVNELWFDDDDARAAAFGSEHGKAAAGDAAAHTSRRVHILTREHPQL
jgi:uncharacterized protein (TIGR02118 family)